MCNDNAQLTVPDHLLPLRSTTLMLDHSSRWSKFADSEMSLIKQEEAMPVLGMEQQLQGAKVQSRLQVYVVAHSRHYQSGVKHNIIMSQLGVSA